MMEEDNENPEGLVSRISKLFNNGMCSDVVFQVRHNNQKIVFYAHSAILVSAGNGFLELQKQTSQAKVINISDFSPNIVGSMLKYLYTDELNILSMETAVELYKIARVYGIVDLEKACSNYIGKEEVTIDNLFVKYESALSCNFPKLLDKCQNLVQAETKAVFASRYFGEAPFTVIEDMFSLDHLNVSSEMVVIQAALQWSASECRRKGRPTEKLCIRAAIEPLLKHLRFLSLSVDEFCDFTEREDNIFTAPETAIITRKILQPDYKGVFPTHLCRNSKPRQKSIGTNNHMGNIINYSDFYSEPKKEFTFKDPLLEEFNNAIYEDPLSISAEQTFIPKQPLKEAAKKLFLETRLPPRPIKPLKEAAQKNNFNINNFEPVYKNNFNDISPEPVQKNFQEVLNGNNSGNFSSVFPGQFDTGKSSQRDAMFYHQSLEKSSSTPFTRVEPKPLFQYIQKKSSPMLKVMPQSPPSRQTFEFPLQELRKDMRFASQKDIKCNAKIQMRAGAILIHGIELKITEEKHNPNESIEILSCVSNNHLSKVDTINLPLKNNLVSIMYSEPIRVAIENPADIEITIEDLHLSRSFVCEERTYELNSGLNHKAEISVKSNQSNGPVNLLYLINRIIYTCTS